MAEAAPSTSVLVAGLGIRRQAPNFESVAYFNHQIKPIKLADYAGKYVVLFFYPLDFTFVCPTEIIQFGKKAADFRAINCEVIGCSIDSPFVHMEYCKKPRAEGGLGDLEIPLIADVTKKVAKDYGVLLDHTADAGVALRGTFIIDGKGVLRHVSVNDTPVGRNVDETLRLVQAFQYTDVHGEVCPAGWKKGDKTMKTDHEADMTKDYWKNVHAAQ